ncbi:MAG: hypothetical protein R2851_27685 [Caldilineaceae bacterium]
MIARKHEVSASWRTRRALDPRAARQGKPQPRRIRRLEAELDRLMAEEYRLRLAIDQAR